MRQAASPFREDGYFNMTKAAQHFGKQLQHLWANKETAEYLMAMAEMEANIGIPMNELYIAKRGGTPGTAGTWAHPKLAVFFARWLDVRFAVWCDMQIDDILHGLQANRGSAPGRSVVVPVWQAPAPEPQQLMCPAVHQRPATATTTP